MISTKLSLALAVTLALPALGLPAFAQVTTIGSTTGGATGQIGRAIAATVSELAPVQMRPQEMANTSDYMPLVNNGEIDFGISNVVQLWYAFNGTGMSVGQPAPELRQVATLMPFLAGLQVAADSDIQSVADVRGKRVPAFPDASLGDHVLRAFLANAGLTYADVIPVPVPNFPRMWDSFRERSTDVTIDVPGSANSRELDQALGGIRFLSFENDPAKITAMQEWLPQMFLQTVSADAGILGITESTNINAYAYTMFTNAGMDDDTVYEVAKAMHAGEAALVATGPIWAEYDAAALAAPVSVPFHPGAIRFYQEIGIWKD